MDKAIEWWFRNSLYGSVSSYCSASFSTAISSVGSKKHHVIRLLALVSQLMMAILAIQAICELD